MVLNKEGRGRLPFLLAIVAALAWSEWWGGPPPMRWEGASKEQNGERRAGHCSKQCVSRPAAVPHDSDRDRGQFRSHVARNFLFFSGEDSNALRAKVNSILNFYRISITVY